MERYCPYCMHPVQPGQPCPNCKRDPETYRPESRQLPPGTLLQERYVLGRALWVLLPFQRFGPIAHGVET